MSYMIFVFQNLLAHDISKEGNNTLLSQLFTNIFFTIGQEQTSLLNHCLSTQRWPHARPCTMPSALLSFIKNSPKVSSWSESLLKFPFVNNTLLSINNRKIFQILNKPLSCACIQSRFQFLLHKGYSIGA